jgi:branched-chain amino acid transport system permease protein
MSEQPQEQGPRIGVDEWVARVAENRSLGRLQQQLERVPLAARLGAFVLPMALFPLFTSSGYLMQVAIDTLIFMLLALGLNVALGFAGLLDLGYIAFFGFGAYGYTMFASGHFNLHWDAQWAIPIVVAATIALGFLVGLPSRRLVGDYLAIVTLFFLQIFLVVLLNADRLSLPFIGTTNLTRGPNGISDVDPMSFFGWKLTSLDDYFYLALIAFAVVLLGLRFLEHSRTGRAWRALREDPLAAELMSMPVSRLKLLAFAFGAGIGGLTGTIFAAEQGAVFPVNFDLTLLITLYAMVILGGVGSLFGVAVGAIVINVTLEALRTPQNASWIFFGLVALVLLAAPKPRWLGPTILAAVVAFGFVVHATVDALWPAGVAGATVGEARIDGIVDSWVLLPENPDELGKWGYLVLVAAVLGLTLLQGWWRWVALVPTLYLAACVWENVLVEQPAVARYILIGAMLVGLMAARPQGLFGQARVEIV